MKHLLKATLIGLALGLAIPAGAHAHDTQVAAEQTAQKTASFTIEKNDLCHVPDHGPQGDGKGRWCAFRGYGL